LRLTVGFRFGEDQYVARIDEAGIVVERGRAAAADIAFTGQPTALAAFTYGKVPLDSLDGALMLDGDPELAARFASLFTLPAKFYPPRR